METQKVVLEYSNISLDEAASINLSRSSSASSLYSTYSLSSTSSSRPKTYFCEYDGCTKSFTRPSILTEHQLSVHQGIKPFKCDSCGRAFVKKSHLERHLYSHSAEKPFHCSHCGKGVTTKQQLRRHEITHTKSFKCTYDGCGECFYKHPQLRSHILSVHEQKLICPQCGKSFQRPYRLNSHISKHHNPNSEFNYQCSYLECTKAFRTWSGLQQHIKTEHPKIPCPKCGKQCVGENGLKMHMTVHDESLVLKNWKCSICGGVSFAKKADLVAHFMESHENEVIDDNLKDYNEAACGWNETLPERDRTVMHDVPDKGKRNKRKLDDGLCSIEAEVKIRRFIDSGNSGASLLLNSVGKKTKCPYLGCSRSFKTIEKYNAHISRHKIHELKLKLLEDKNPNKDEKMSESIEDVTSG